MAVLYSTLSFHLVFVSVLAYFISLYTNFKFGLFLFALYFFVGIYGGGVFSVLFLFLGLYSTGYAFRRIFFREVSNEAINIPFGLVVVFYPITSLSILSTTRLANLSFIFHDTIGVVAICILILSVSTLYFLIKESVYIKEYFSFIHKSHYSISKANGSDFIFYILISVVFIIVNYSFVPLINYDDMGTHYPLQHRFARGMYPTFDIRMHVWGVSQWIFDIYYGFFEYFFPKLGRNILNSILALSTSAIAFQLFRHFSNRTQSLFFVVASLSTPLFVLSLTTSQTELITTLLLIALVYVFIRYTRRSFVLSLPLFAFAVAIKPSNAVLFIFPFIVFIIKEFKRFRFSNTKNIHFWLVLILSTVGAIVSYLFAFYKTKNPFFPLFNGYFKAEYFPDVNFFNSLYAGHFSIQAFWGLMFNSQMYLESDNYVGGFQLILLPLLLCISLVFYKKCNGELLALFISIIAGAVALFHSQQYARYLMPCIFLLPAFYFFIFKDVFNVKLKKAIILMLLTATAANIFFIPNVIWYLRTWDNNFSLIKPTTQQTAQLELDHILSVNEFINSLPGEKNVVYPLQKPYAANLNGNYIYINWYNTSASEAMQLGHENLVNYLKKVNATYFIIDEYSKPIENDIAIKYGDLIFNNSGYQVYRLNFNLPNNNH